MDFRMTEPPQDFVTERIDRLNRLVGQTSLETADLAFDFPLLKVIRLPASTIRLLQDAARLYVWENLAAWFGDDAVEYGPNILEDNIDKISSLPNRTPNGLILPRRPAMTSFNMLHRVLVQAFRRLGLTRQFHAIQLPVNVRVVVGADPDAVGKRPFASSKIHSDSWNKEPMSAVLFNLPLLGDPAKIAIRYFALRHPHPEMFAPVDDYDVMQIAEENLIHYDAPFAHGHLYLSDQASLHQTVRADESQVRLSLDFRAVMHEILPYESYDVSQSCAHYGRAETWDGLGEKALLASDFPLDAFQRKLQHAPLADAHADLINIDTMVPS